jgi:hypothetical protein
MAILDKPMKSVAQTLGNVLGSKASSGVGVLVRESQTYDPLNDSGGTQSEIEYPVTVFPPKQYRLDQIDGSVIQNGDFMIDIPAKDLALPAPNEPSEQTDTIKFNGERFKIMSVTKIYSGASVVLYTLQCRS